FTNPLILKAVSLNHLKIMGKNLSDPFRSTLSIPVYSGRFYHNFITMIFNENPLSLIRLNCPFRSRTLSDIITHVVHQSSEEVQTEESETL
ncbi:MAG: hypothetical protein ABIG80_05615, partial [Patescibacteria group bacterium]